MKKSCFFLGLGSNLGDRLFNINTALLAITDSRRIEILQCSSIYETDPVGPVLQQDFLNMVIKISTNLLPPELLNEIKKIESEMGRAPEVRWGPRLIDIDILFWDRGVFRNGRLEIPHPQASNRRFVLLPLSEIAPDFVSHKGGDAVTNLLNECPDSSRVIRYEQVQEQP